MSDQPALFPDPAPQPLMTIPEIAAELRKLAALHDLPRLLELSRALRRRKLQKRTRPRSRRITPQLQEQVRAYFVLNPGASHQQAADHFQINSGRVSEALHGKRQEVT